jgi:hypothetical protein
MKFSQSILALLLLCFLSGGCAAHQNQGEIVRSEEVTQLIESKTVLPDHTYYYTGPEAEPDAIIAIDNRFALQSKYWIKVDDAAEKLMDWNRIIDNAHRVPGEHGAPWIRSTYAGARIMTSDGRRAGLWYSRHEHTVVQFPDASTIILYTPVVPVETEIRILQRN